MPGLPFTLRSRSFSENLTVTACCRQSDGTLKAISNAMVSMASESLAKASRTLYNECRDLEKVGNRIVAITSVNTCKR